MSTPILLTVFIALLIFVIVPGLRKFRAALGIMQMLKSDALPFSRRVSLNLLGMKTPFLNTLAFAWTFVTTEGDELRGFAWDEFMSHEHAVWVATALWAAGIWSHFSGLQIAAATSPVITPLPSAVPVPPTAPTA